MDDYLDNEVEWVEIGGVGASIFGASEITLLFQMFHSFAKNMGLQENVTYKVELNEIMGSQHVVMFLKADLYDTLTTLQEDLEFSFVVANKGVTLLH